MRNIIFRGKGIYHNKWVYGYYCNCRPPKRKQNETRHYIVEYPGIYHEIYIGTVGQYTGMQDKTGAEIFEGDIVRYTFDSPNDPMATKNGLIPRIGRVFWSEWRASFAVTLGKNGSDMLNNDIARYVRGRSIYEYVRGANTVEIIGNIHDNPELLEEDKND